MGGGKENGQKACLWSLETPIPHSGSTLREIDPKNGMAFSMMQKAEDHIHGGGKKKKWSFWPQLSLMMTTTLLPGHWPPETLSQNPAELLFSS